MHFFLYVYVSHYSLQDHRHHAHWLPLSPLHPALCNTRISLPQHSSPSTCSHFKTQQRQMPAIRKKRVLWCNCLSTLLGNISFRQLIKYIPGPIQHPVTREITAMANKGKRPQVTGSRRKKAGFEGKQLPRALAAQQQPPAPPVHPAKGLGTLRRARTQAERSRLSALRHCCRFIYLFFTLMHPFALEVTRRNIKQFSS